MSKYEGVKTVVFNGKKGTTQQYCGTVGGQSTDFSTIDTEIKTTHLKNNSLAPPDLLVNGIQGITWRLAFGINNPQEPEGEDLSKHYGAYTTLTCLYRMARPPCRHQPAHHERTASPSYHPSYETADHFPRESTASTTPLRSGRK
ncbi:hypothetical protein DXG03_000904 [Asterophora parasitica]|uniref:Uncharacterized protein n=1 Tax=Asterophora parasitica TaxID=117018 RepID=A0A9P7K8Q1_9AGAR|nr:hypothetical protein DXG03_000904 [Asterophora parasitica]